LHLTEENDSLRRSRVEARGGALHTKATDELTLHDRLSHLSHAQACRLLGAHGAALLREGGALEIEIDAQVHIEDDRFVLELPDAQVTLTLASEGRFGLGYTCSTCPQACAHAGAAFSLILEEKLALGLAAPPPERARAAPRSESDLTALALEERRERARVERMRVHAVDGSGPWGDYLVTSGISGRTYRVALRGLAPGISYCSCPDFRTNTLGTCKHLLKVQAGVQRRFPAAALRRPFRRRGFSVYLRYGASRELHLGVPERPLPTPIEAIVSPLRSGPITDAADLLRRIQRLELLGHDVTVYPDAEEYVQEQLFGARIRTLVDEIRADPAAHPLRKELLAVELLPYQLDGIAFAAGAGRAILADEMGLGKTMQGIGLAELLRREAGIERVLVVCPASLKSQWRREIERASRASCQLVIGPSRERPAQYRSACFFTIVNYEQVLRDHAAIQSARFDLVVLDEAQRIKNWEAKTSRAVKALRSRFALALTGTPLENRLDELYSVVEFVDERRLGPAFRFFHRHRTLSETGRVLGYENLDELRRALAPVLLRRTRASVRQDLPARTTEFVRVVPTEQQSNLHRGFMQTVAAVLRKRFISEMDLLRLRKALLGCRLAADSTALVDKQLPGHSSKLERLEELLPQLLREEGRKIVLFSEWTSMLDLVETRLRKWKARFVRLDGSVPQRKRQALVDAFSADASCSLFLTTNAGATGLNLQAADTVVNVDLPWNPALLEQRIARVHRMGQTRPVQVFILISEGTLEEQLLGTLAAKHELAQAVLDPDSEVEAVDLTSNVEELRGRLEVLLGAQPEAAVDARDRASHERELEARRERIATAGGTLVGAAFSFLSELLPAESTRPGADYLTDLVRKQLAECLEEDTEGRPRLSVVLPDRTALDALARSLGHLLAERTST
jgi:superfamily II DNA or RNA helicase